MDNSVNYGNCRKISRLQKFCEVEFSDKRRQDVRRFQIVIILGP
jgi:hypothetical protein